MGLGMFCGSTLNGNFSVSTAKRLVNKKADENMLLAASNLSIKSTTWSELFVDTLKVVCTLGLVFASRLWKADDKVRETVEFAYRLVSLGKIGPIDNEEHEFTMMSGDVIKLRTVTNGNGNKAVEIKINDDGFVELCEGSLTDLQGRFKADYREKENADMYKMFSNLAEEITQTFDEAFLIRPGDSLPIAQQIEEIISYTLALQGKSEDERLSIF